MFQLDSTHPSVIYRRQSGRLMRPSDRLIRTNGLGEVDGILDTLKNFGSGIVKFTTAGIYDPSKNRFYVPFSSGQMRTWAQGAVNTTTLGLVKTDKFFGSQTMKTIGTVAGAALAAGVVAYGGSKLYKAYGSTPSTAPGAPGSPVYGPPTPAKVAAPTGSLFSTPSLSTVKKGLDVLNMATKVVGGPSGGAQLPPAGSGGAPIIIMTGDNPQPVVGQPSYGSYGFDPLLSTGLMPPGGGVLMPGGGGGGGGFGPPGSEYAGMQQQQELMPEEGMSMGMKLALVLGVGAIAYFVVLK